MNYEYSEPVEDEVKDPEPDPRVVAMQQVVDAEKRAGYAEREFDQAQKRLAIAREELSEARDHLNGLLGLPSNNVGANKPMRGGSY